MVCVSQTTVFRKEPYSFAKKAAMASKMDTNPTILGHLT